MPSLPPVRIAVIGFTGVIGTRHTADVLANPSTTLVAAVDPSPTASAIAAAHSVPYFRSVRELLSSETVPKPDAAIICTPNSTHTTVAKELAAAGIHMLIEKPLSISVEDGQDLVQYLREKGVRALVGHQRRLDRYVIAAKKVIDQGLLGGITAVSAIWVNYKEIEYFNSGPEITWRSSRSAGGGVVMMNLVHEIDILQYFFGPITRVHGEKTITRRSQQDVGVEEHDRAEEGAALTFRFQSGVVGTFVVSDHVVSPHNLETCTRDNPYGLAGPGLEDVKIDTYRILGTESSLTMPDMVRWFFPEGEVKGRLTALQRETIPVDDDPRDPYTRQLDNLVAVVRGEAEPSCSAEDGLRTVLVCDAITRALDSETGTVLVPKVSAE